MACRESIPLSGGHSAAFVPYVTIVSFFRFASVSPSRDNATRPISTKRRTATRGGKGQGEVSLSLLAYCIYFHQLCYCYCDVYFYCINYPVISYRVRINWVFYKEGVPPAKRRSGEQRARRKGETVCLTTNLHRDSQSRFPFRLISFLRFLDNFCPAFEDDGGSIDRSIDTRSHVRHANYIPADSRAYVRARVAGCVRAPAKQKLAILEKVTIPSRITRCLFPRNAENPCLSSFQFHHDQSSIRFSRDSSRFSSSRERRMPRVPFARELFFRAPAKTTPDRFAIFSSTG